MALGAASLAGAETPVIPQYGPDKHEGVSSCDGSGCHGSAAPRNDRNVMQNEYSVWADEDRHHTRAYKILLEKASIRISRNLGRKKKPHQDDLCLDCHADNPPPDKRRSEDGSFRIEDGVGCEGCHGGAERYLRPHDSGSTHARNIALGMYPTDQPVARTRLCLSCHFGDRRKFVDHRLMGAGHPRQSFEVALFSILQPYHWEPDADYLERGKAAPNDVQLWAIGQAIAVDEVLDAMLDPDRNRLGLFPELVLYDCHACHHPIDKNVDWTPRASTGLGPGVPRLNDANFLMLMQSVRLVDEEAAQRLRQSLRSLHQAASEGRGNAEATAKAIRAEIAKLLPKLEAWKVDEKALRSLASQILSEGSRGEYSDYAGSEQAAMALQTILYNFLIAGLVDDATYDAIDRGELSKLLATVRDPDTFDPTRARAAFRRLQSRLASP
ncbi:MAG TPA: multiheme c-type cytochrome [Myxococcota bacterium]|nr:multiheme c-type cytochrome [Myxococcota bacterium]